ncbi:MAG: hypothetical protein AAF366_21545 [Pseudomonadota bacterium]
MKDVAQIGEGQGVHAAPALRRSLAEIVADYDDNADDIPQAIATFEAAETAINMAGCIGGTFGGQIFARLHSLSEGDTRKLGQAPASEGEYTAMPYDQTCSQSSPQPLSRPRHRRGTEAAISGSGPRQERWLPDDPFFRGTDVPVFLLGIYGKGAKANLTKAERNDLARILPELADAYRARKQRS